MARDLESERAALLKRAESVWRWAQLPEKRAQLDATERAELDAAEAALARLLDLNTAPQQADFRAVVKVAPKFRLALLAWIDRRLGPVRYATWFNALYPAPQPIPPKTPTAPAIGASVAKVKPTETQKLDADRRRYEATGKVTNRLLQAMWARPHSTVSYRLKTLRDAGEIASAEGEKLTAKEVQIALKDVEENPFKESTRKRI